MTSLNSFNIDRFLNYKYRIKLNVIDTNVKEIYNIFKKLDIDKDELDYLLFNIDLDRKKVEAKIMDIALYVLIKHGLKHEHCKRISYRLKKSRYRCNSLESRIKYLTNLLNQYTIT